MEQVGGAELRELWVEFVGRLGPLTSDQLLRELRRRELTPKGDSYKARIRNIHSAATNEKRLRKARPGVFELNE